MEKNENVYELTQIPSSFVPGIKTPEGEIITVEQSLVYILNFLKDLKKGIAG